MKKLVRHIVHAESCCSPCLINTVCALWDYRISAILFLVAERASAAWFSIYWNRTTTTKHFPVKVLTAWVIVLSVFLIFVTWVLWLAKARLGRVFCPNKSEKKWKMGRIVPWCLSESGLALTRKRNVPQMCLHAGRVVRVAKLRTLLVSFLHCPLLLFLHLLCFWGGSVIEWSQYLACVGVLSNQQPCSLLPGSIDAEHSYKCLKRKYNSHWSFLSQWGVACTYFFLRCCTLSLSFPPPLSLSWSPFSKEDFVYLPSCMTDVVSVHSIHKV